MAHRAEQERATQKRDAIQRAALDILTREGLRGITHRQVATAAGVPVGSIGYYFSTRDKLVLSCFHRLHEQRRAEYQEVPETEDFPRDAGELSMLLVRVLSGGNPELLSNIISAYVEVNREGEAVREPILAELRETYGWVLDLLKRAGHEKAEADSALLIMVGAAVAEAFVPEKRGRKAQSALRYILEMGRG